MQLMYWLQPPVVSPEVPTDEEAQQQQNSDSSIMPSDPSLSTQASKVSPGASKRLAHTCTIRILGTVSGLGTIGG